MQNELSYDLFDVQSLREKFQAKRDGSEDSIK